jgi:hypothetical protein
MRQDWRDRRGTRYFGAATVVAAWGVVAWYIWHLIVLH